ncbi:hypothetical protein BKH41_08205 [Helicobacter sp. 12S02232-10]|nr:hypothetical protein BKH41_08205 [Helicobacter sp. 12S02232-10]
MKAKLLFGFLLIVIFALSVYILFFYYTSIPKDTFNINHNESAVEKNKIQGETLWLQSLLTKSQNYSYPATEIKIGVNFRSPNEKINPTKLVIQHLDNYKFFCLNEVLKQEKIEFAYYQTGNSIDIVIFLPNDSRKKQIIEDLKHYEIQYKAQ